jgi:hypothetical protein
MTLNDNQVLYIKPCDSEDLLEVDSGFIKHSKCVMENLTLFPDCNGLKESPIAIPFLPKEYLEYMIDFYKAEPNWAFDDTNSHLIEAEVIEEQPDAEPFVVFKEDVVLHIWVKEFAEKHNIETITNLLHYTTILHFYYASHMLCKYVATLVEKVDADAPDWREQLDKIYPFTQYNILDKYKEDETDESPEDSTEETPAESKDESVVETTV